MFLQEWCERKGESWVPEYVDDILLSSSSEAAEKLVVKRISEVVPTKTTGIITDSHGSLTFVGRKIVRGFGSDELQLSGDPTYLDGTFADYGIQKGTDHVPDISRQMERIMLDAKFQTPLTDAAYQKFRKALGKLLWLSQVRRDLKAWLSTIETMSWDRASRFLKSDMHTVLCLPSRSTVTMEGVSEEQMLSTHLHSFSDASHAPYRFNARRGISGGAVFFEGSLIRTMSRQQQSQALSSCEAELYALQSVA